MRAQESGRCRWNGIRGNEVLSAPFPRSRDSNAEGPRLGIVVGNPKPGSRTLQVARSLADRIAVVTGGHIAFELDLVRHAEHLFDLPNEGVTELVCTVAATDILVVASPTYKASYTGLLKAFLDRFPANGLAGVSALPVMTADAPIHAMAVEVYLRPLLVEMGATVPTRGFFFPISEMASLNESTVRWVDANIRSELLSASLWAQAHRGTGCGLRNEGA